MNWIVMIGLASLVSAGNSVLDKRLMNGPAVRPIACTLSVGLVSVPVAIIGICLLPPIPWLAAVEAMLAGLLYLIAVWFYYTLVAREDISIVVPLLRVTTVQTLLGGVIFLGSRLNLHQSIAFAILLVCSVLLSIRANPNGKPGMSRAFAQVLPVTTLLTGSNLLLSAIYQNHAITLWHGQVWEAAGTASGLLIIGAISLARGHHLGNIADRQSWRVLLGEQSVRVLTGLAPAWAMTQHVPVALISATSGLSPLYVWVLATVFLGERTGRAELLLKMVGITGSILAVLLLD
jgi:drug/metabolite transporter (DMT)-like permease